MQERDYLAKKQQLLADQLNKVTKQLEGAMEKPSLKYAIVISDDDELDDFPLQSELMQPPTKAQQQQYIEAGLVNNEFYNGNKAAKIRKERENRRARLPKPSDKSLGDNEMDEDPETGWIKKVHEVQKDPIN